MPPSMLVCLLLMLRLEGGEGNGKAARGMVSSYLWSERLWSFLSLILHIFSFHILRRRWRRPPMIHEAMEARSTKPKAFLKLMRTAPNSSGMAMFQEKRTTMLPTMITRSVQPILTIRKRALKCLPLRCMMLTHWGCCLRQAVGFVDGRPSGGERQRPLVCEWA